MMILMVMVMILMLMLMVVMMVMVVMVMMVVMVVMMMMVTMMMVMMMMTKTHIIKRGLANGKFDGFSAVSHQLNHMVPGRPDEDEDEFRQIFWISAFLF